MWAVSVAVAAIVACLLLLPRDVCARAPTDALAPISRAPVSIAPTDSLAERRAARGQRVLHDTSMQDDDAPQSHVGTRAPTDSLAPISREPVSIAPTDSLAPISHAPVTVAPTGSLAPISRAPVTVAPTGLLALISRAPPVTVATTGSLAPVSSSGPHGASTRVEAAVGAASRSGASTFSSSNFLFYNRIPKAGSTTMMSLLHSLSTHRRNLGARGGYAGRQFEMNHSIRGGGAYFLELPFAPNTVWTEKWEVLKSMQAMATPKMGQVYINHIFRPNFTAAGLPEPLSINVMREPLARAVSVHYYTLWGPRPAAKMLASREKSMQHTGLDHPATINEHVAWTRTQPGGEGCLNTPHANMQTRFFCGFHAMCANVCSEEALQRAMLVLDTQYLVVGVLERLQETLLLLELEAPDWFANISDVHKSFVAYQDRHHHGHLKKTNGAAVNELPTNATLAVLARNNRQDIKLYAFATEKFNEKWKRHRPTLL